MQSVQIVLFDGFDLLDAIAPYEVFCAAEMLAGGVMNVEFVTAEGPRLVPSGINGLKIEASGKLNPERAGIIVVPGASGEVQGNGPQSIPAILARAMNTALTGMMQQALKQPDIIVATVCGGSLLLAMGGLLEGRTAVTHHMGMDVLGATGVIPVAARVVDDGNLISGGGVTSGLDVALYLVEHELGPRIAHAVEQLFEFERRGTVWQRTGIAPRAHQESADENGETDRMDTKKTATSGVTFHNPATTSSVFDGDWDTTIATPVGKLQVKLSITTSNGIIQGKATQGNETVDFLNPVVQDNKLLWSLKITKPMRLNLKFEVETEGEDMTGIAKAGILPASKLTGKKVI
ncbi:DJ-1/PfpI family protein [Paenibacillus radicis (ex Gao et al. 2016)]|uniref:DJ-1/PfpI domain-containing protein n=1 Tax=Paenibacillus radicis (ex Gao et al. 2016) TaxID=1737354 RepID=A0A917GQ19_9BACL|nr:DJ-1/PfpI family protein [Paenibacillus radicis (ex Gao et al. 2016)]GGG53215.1 hypothetical protein GCM10010918_02340 [Paenibacillus radicis (ex Gao et al. 2016)]